MKLYTYYRSSAAYRVRIVLHLKKVVFESITVNLFAREQDRPEYLDINAQGFVPVLEIEDGRRVSQSLAIFEWLETRFKTPPLLPLDAYEAAKVREGAALIACDIHPVNNLRVLTYLVETLKSREEQKIAWYHHWIQTGFTALEAQISASPYCYGETVTFADACLIPQIYNALRFRVDLSPFPKLLRVYEACKKLPAFLAAHPDQQPDHPDRI